MSHTGMILLCIIYSPARYYALAFFTLAGLINVIHDFDIEASLLCLLVMLKSRLCKFVNYASIGCACMCHCRSSDVFNAVGLFEVFSFFMKLFPC